MDYFDAMRGFAMFLVVWMHFLLFVFCDEYGAESFFIRFRMPLFFFVSGFFSYSTLYDFPRFKRRVGNRLQRQLLPTLAVGAIYFTMSIFVSGGRITWLGIFLDETKMGYWFTLSLVEVFVVFAVIAHLLYRLKLTGRQQTVAWIVILVVVQCVKTVFDHTLMSIPSDVRLFIDFFSIHHSVYFMPFFFFGVACRACEDRFFACLSRLWIVALFYVLFAMSAVATSHEYICLFVSAYSGVMMVAGTFYALRGMIRPGHWFWGRLIYAGKNTLPIYLYHYFFLRLFSGLMAEFFDPDMFGVVSRQCIAVIGAVAVMWLTLRTDRLLSRYAAPVHQFVFGA